MLIKEWLNEENVTGKDFAMALELTPAYFYNIIEEKQRPSRKLACKIEMYTGGKVSARELLEVELRAKIPKRQLPKESNATITIPLKEYLLLKGKVA